MDIWSPVTAGAAAFNQHLTEEYITLFLRSYLNGTVA